MTAMPVLPEPPLTDSDLVGVVARLTEDQKRAVLEYLLPPFLMGISSPRAVTDSAGTVLGHFVPATTLGPDNLFPPPVNDEPPTMPITAPPGRRLRTVADGGTDPTDIGAGD